MRILKKIILFIFSPIIILLEKLLRKKIYTFAIRPFLVGLPGATVASYKIEPVYSKIPSNVVTWFNDNIYWIIGLYFFIPVVIGLEEIIKSEAKKINQDLTNESYALFLKAIDYPVAKKMDRFLSVFTQNKGQKIPPGEIFNKITKPDVQLAEIIRSIHLFFDGLSRLLDSEDIEFRTALFEITNNTASSIWCYFPEDSRPEKELINDNGSIVAHTVRNGSIVIVEDLESERKKSKPRISTYCHAESGSVVCYPITCKHTGNIPLAIRVVATSNFFTANKKRLYNSIFNRFEKRILIEYALTELKKNAD